MLSFCFEIILQLLISELVSSIEYTEHYLLVLVPIKNWNIYVGMCMSPIDVQDEFQNVKPKITIFFAHQVASVIHNTNEMDLQPYLDTIDLQFLVESDEWAVQGSRVRRSESNNQ